MNEVALAGIIKLVKKMIPPGTIQELANSLIQSAIEFKRSIPLDAEKDEKEIIGSIFEKSGQVFYCIHILNSQNQIVRTVNTQPIETLINQIIEKI